MTTEIETSTETTSKRLRESEWLVVTNLWEMGDVTLKELSEKFKVSEAALSQGLKRRGIKRGSKAHLAFKEIEMKSKEEREKLIEDIYNFKKRFLRYGDFLMTLTMNEITDAKKGGTLVTARPALDAIGAATKVYKTIRNDMFHLYDLYNPDNKPQEDMEFNIGVYSEKDIDALREAQELYAKEFADRRDKDEEDEEDDFPLDEEES